MPLMCATGRVRFLNSGEKGATALEWDDGPPWELSLRVVADEPKGDWRVEGQLCRENEILPLARTVLLVPGGLVLTPKKIARLRDFGAFAWVTLCGRETSSTSRPVTSTTLSTACSTCPPCRGSTCRRNCGSKR